MANPEHVEVVRKGAEAIAEWRRSNPGAQLDVAGATLIGAKLGGADLSRALLVDADLWGATLSSASLTGANLILADLTNADLAAADLSDAHLQLASLNGTNLNAANVSQARLGFTALGRLDLSQVNGLAAVSHGAPSSVGVDTLIASFRGAGNKLTPELEAFFRGAGVAEELLRELPRLVAEVKYYSCFISHGQPDLGFAEKLRADLVGRGVSCWLYPMDRTPGERTWEEITKMRRQSEKVVVVCSGQALVRDGVLKEIEEQEDEDPDKNVPISLDDLWKEPGFRVMRGSSDLKALLLDRNYADFAGWESDPAQYQKALSELLKGLRRRDG